MKLRLDLKYVNRYRDRHGRIRHYFRRPRQAAIALPGEPGSDEFMEAYKAALADRRKPQIGSWPADSVGAAIAGYYGHNSFLVLGDGTRKSRRAILERFREHHGNARIAALTREHVEAIFGKLKPQAVGNWRRALRGLMKFAVANGLRKDDPTAEVKLPRFKAGRIHTWDEAEIAQYEAQHPCGTKARLAMALMLYSGQRKSDMVRMVRNHVRGGKLIVRQQKTGMEKADEWLEIPIHPELDRIIALTAIGNMNLLVTEYGKPFTAAGFGNKMRQWCDEAGLPQCSSHGLRKAICRRLAEAGCTAPQIASISGHKSLKEVQRYIEQANQAKMAEDAVAKITPAPASPGTVVPFAGTRRDR